MNWWQRLRRRNDLERQLDAELRDHLERQVEGYVASGMPEADARRRARLEFGGLEATKETCRDARGLRVFEDAVQDVRYAVRTFRASPGFTLVAVLTLALGIGANAAIFSLVNALLFRTLPLEKPQTLVFVANCAGSERVIDHLGERRDIFAHTAGWMPTQFSLGGGDEAGWVDGLWVTGRYFTTLRIQPWAGHTLRQAGPAVAPEAMISHAFWRRRFGGAPHVVGRAITINHRPFTIAGITPPGFTGMDVGRTFDVVVPFSAYPLVTGSEPEGCGPLSVVARLADGHTVASAAAALLDLQPQIRDRLMPEHAAPDARARFLSRPFAVVPASGGGSDLRPRYERPLFTIMVVAGLVLLIACATIANLLLARTTARRQELGVRLAVGASRGRLVRQLLLESLLVAGLGATAGLLVGWWGSRLIVSALSAEGVLATGRIIFGSARLFLDVSLDWHVMVFTAAVAVATCLLFGLAPAIRASRLGPVRTLTDEAPSRVDRRTGTASSLVVAQVALSLVLVVAAGLFLRSLSSLLDVPLGFEPERMLVVDITTPAAEARHVRHLPLYERARDVVGALPGVADATLSVSAPMTGWDLLVEVKTGHAVDPGGEGDSLANIVSPGWFRTLGTPLVAGRDFTDDDREDTPPVVMVNEAFARQFLRGSAPLGRTITITGMGTESTPREIVGIAADALWSLRDPVPPILYVPMAQADEDSLEIRLDEEGLTLGVRAASGAPHLLTPGVVAALGAIDPRLTLTFRSPAEHISASLTQERVVAMLSGFFGVLALILAGVGLYGITAYAVSCRRTEIGVRLALGGTPAEVVRLVLTRLSLLVAAGIVVGIAASAWLAPFVSALLYGVGPRDWLTLSAAVATLAVVTAVAGCVPAYRASRIDLVEALRLE